jgi:TonB family protein
MNHLHQKCILASTGVHALLALILLFCPAFLSPKSKLSEVTPITFYPDLLIDQPFANPGGSPGSRPPAPTPTPTPAPPAPVVKPAPAPPPQPVRETVREVTPPKTSAESLEVTKEPAKKKPEISLTPVVRKPNAKPNTKPSTKPASDEASEVDTQAHQQAARRQQQMLGQLDRTLGNIRSGTASPTRIEEGVGEGNIGPSYASYAAWVWSFYESAWVRPEDATIEDATVEVNVTIASDGTVIAKRITRRSGDHAVDASVQSVLDRVTTVKRPFPEGAKDKQRSYIIPFNMKTHRGTA